MMQQEFEKLAGYEVSTSDYHDIIEPMYMAVNLSKQEFVKVIDKKRFALKTKSQIISEMKKLAQGLMETCDHYTDFDAQKKLEDLLDELTARFYAGAYTFIQTATTSPNYRGCSFPEFITICYGSKYHESVHEQIRLTTPWYKKA